MIEDVFRSARHARAMSKLHLPRKSIRLRSPPSGSFFLLDLASVDPHTLLHSAALGFPHDHVSATHSWWREWLSVITTRWLTLLLQPPPQSPHEHEVSRRLFRPYTSTSHNVTKGRYITSNDPRGYMYVLAVASTQDAPDTEVVLCTSILSTTSGS